MADLLSGYFSPLGRNSCVYFLILSVMFFISLVLILFSELLYIAKNFKHLNFRTMSHGILILFNVFLAYFVNRLFYTMCNNSTT